MRNFKFRVWSAVEKKWMFGYECPNLGGFSMVGETILLGEWGRYPLERYFEDFVIMQSSDKFDSNDKEIYEGDIVRFGDGQVSKVEWKEGGLVAYADFGDYDMTLIGWAMEALDGCEVIGNVYENAELLSK